MTNETKNTLPELTALVRGVVEAIDKCGPEGVAAIVAPLRERVSPRVHVGRAGLEVMPLETLEWYAGQILDIVDTKAWFAMNSIINCVDKFAPAVRP